MRSVIILCLMGTSFVVAMVGGVVWLKSSPASDSPRARMAAASSAAPPAQMMQIPDFQLPRVLGAGDFAFAAAQGRVTVVNFWASWCSPCQREFPSFLAAADKLGSDYLWVLVSVDEDGAAIVKFLKGFDVRKANVEILWDASSTVARSFGTVQLPESYIFDKNKRFNRKLVGFADWDSEELRAYLRKLREG